MPFHSVAASYVWRHGFPPLLYNQEKRNKRHVSSCEYDTFKPNRTDADKWILSLSVQDQSSYEHFTQPYIYI